VCSATVKEKKNQYRDFSIPNQNSVQLDPTEKNDASQSKMAIWEDISSWPTEEVQSSRKEKLVRKKQYFGLKRSMQFEKICFH